MSMNRQQSKPSFTDEAASKEPSLPASIALWVFVTCLVAVMVMGTIKLALVMFS